jgi:C1A family cysteine protease
MGLLRSLWVETVEEAIAMAAALPVHGQSEHAAALQVMSMGLTAASVPPERIAVLQQPQKGGGLGCLLDAQTLESFRSAGRLRSPRPLPSGAFEGSLPRAVRLRDRMQPVRDQGERGTCVAFASVALREFLLPKPDDLSAQFLYWGCKELDGLPDAGTYIHTAMTVFAQYGVCPEEVWPYNPKQAGSEGQGPPPRGAREAAQSCRLSSTRTVEPGLVLHYKHVLAGENGKGGMPVTFGVLVFDSWYMSAETHRTGKITLPLPGEQPAGGHAMCVVGYVDDDTVPGGGYFIVRNSWGAKWASDSPEAAGHALMPYDYVERFAMEAFTGSAPASDRETPSESSEWRDFVRTLEKDGRDLDGRLLKRGTKVLANPGQPEAFREDSPQSRQEFLRFHRAWTLEYRSHVWFPAKPDWPADFLRESAHVKAARQSFLGAIEENLKTSVGTPFPDINLPSLASLLPWQPRIRRFIEEADLTADILPILLRATGHPPDVAPPREWEDAFVSMNTVRLYRLRSLTADILVVAAFVSPLSIRPGQPPVFAPPSADALQAVRDRVAQRLAAAPQRRPVYTFYSVASAAAWPEGMKGIAAGDHCILLSHRTASGDWHTLSSPFFATRTSFRNFLERIYPVTRQERVSRIKATVDALLAEGYQANITVEKIAKQTGYRQTTVQDAFVTMQQVSPDKYRVQRPDRQQVAIRPCRPGEPVKITAASFQKGFLRRHFLLLVSAAVGVSGWLARDWLVKNGFVTSEDLWSIVILISLVYVTGLLQTQINRRASEEKE